MTEPGVVADEREPAERRDPADRRDPTAEAASRLPRSPACPFCEGEDTELANAFGPHASVASYWCRRCRSPFEFMRWTEREGGAGRG